MRFQLFRVESGSGIRAERVAVGIVGIRGKAETHRAGVALATPGIEAREPCSATERENENPRCQRIERAEMADAAKSDEAAHGFDDVVRSLSTRLIDDEDSVERRRLWGPGHEVRFGIAAKPPAALRFLRGLDFSQQIINVLAVFFRLF